MEYTTCRWRLVSYMWGRNAREKVANGGHMCARWLKLAGNAKCWLRRKFLIIKKRAARNCGKRQVNARFDSCIYGPRESQHCFSLLHISRENFSRDGALVTREFYLQSRRGYDHNCWQTPSLTRRYYILSRYTYNCELENSLYNSQSWISIECLCISSVYA